MDEVGIDVSFHTFNTLRGALGERMAGGDPRALTEMVERKLLGRKTGKGFYVYDDAKGGKKKDGPRALSAEALDVIGRFRTSPTSALTAAEMQERMLMRFIKECEAATRERACERPASTCGHAGL